MPLSNQAPKGTADWFPEEFTIRKYIFDTWRQVCLSYGYQEYLTPLVESAEIYRAKSGEDVGGKELVTFTDLGGRELSIRPEMTPSVTRLVSQVYDAVPKPIRYFSIANFMRNEKPQRGRNREFWQLNVDIFGATSQSADIEVLQLALDLMLAFEPPRYSFIICLNHRALIEGLLNLVCPTPQHKTSVVRLMDKWLKLSWQDFASALTELSVDKSSQEKIKLFLSATSPLELLKHLPELADNQGIIELNQIITTLTNLGYGEYLEFKPSVIRGFDYYDGMVFEVFDNHPDNRRALFGGGRYNGLAGIFGAKSFPAVGFAPGDETTRLFLESWQLLDIIKYKTSREIYYLPLLAEDLRLKTVLLARTLRQQGQEVLTGLEEQKLNKALEYANKAGVAKLVIYGIYEDSMAMYKIKDMVSGQETEYKLNS
jgi:histidyl-tRNA synthetase